MIKVAILGANGQVGAEISAYLQHSELCEPIGFVRSEYGAVLLKRLDIHYRVYDPHQLSQSDYAGMLYDCELIVDCAYPSGEAVSIPQRLQENLTRSLSAMRSDGTYILLSSIMAFGMPPRSMTLKNYYIPRTSYARIKRQSEQEAMVLARSLSKRLIIFRMGQVHGILQSVTSQFIQDLSWPQISVSGTDTQLTTTIFASSVAQAVVKCALGKTKPNLYTLVSSPQWTQEQLYSYYRLRYSLPASVVFDGNSVNEAALARGTMSTLLSPLLKQRHLLEAYVIPRFPSLFPYAKGLFRILATRREIAQPNPPVIRHHNLCGKVPGWIISDIASSPTQVLQAERGLDRSLDAVLQRPPLP